VRGQSRFHPIYLTMKNFKMLGLGALGLGALAPELYDWHDPVARITVRRVASMP
jgi:hypothetical protein